MMEIRAAHKEFQAAYSEARNALIPPGQPSLEKDPDSKFPNALLDEDGQFGELYELASCGQLEQGKPQDLSSIFNFLEIDVHAFRCGYLKEWC